MTQDEAKALVGRRAAEMVEDGMAVGLGTGTTSVKFIQALGERVKAGLKIRCVASSDASGALGRSLGMDVVLLAELPELDVYIDGADEVGPGLALIKGGGGGVAAREDCGQFREEVHRGGGLDQGGEGAGCVSAAGRGHQDGAAAGGEEAGGVGAESCAAAA
jgi:hypothetical protein